MKVKYFLQAAAFLFVLLALTVASGADRDYWPTKNWRTSPPEQQGLDSGVLENMNAYVKEKLPLTSSVLVIRHGYIVFEEYYKGNKDDLRTLWSVTKSITSALIGIALKEGRLKSIDQKMIEHFPEFESADLNPDVNNITIRHLLTMSSGFGTNDLGTTNTKTIEYMLNQPLRSEPGKDFAYNSTNAHLLSMIITKTTGSTALDFGMKYLFKPLGISNLKWDDVGYTMGGYGLKMTARDLAKFGFLYLNKGRWGKKQIVTQEWVQESTRMWVEIREETLTGWGLEWLERSTKYGYLWYVDITGGHHSFFAEGAGGQFIHIIPDLDTIIVITTGQIWGSDSKYFSVIDNFVLPSVVKE
jgi:CubicO group peptidase (beta-lactamase class C family)